jgi:hypothetical protein
VIDAAPAPAMPTFHNDTIRRKRPGLKARKGMDIDGLFAPTKSRARMVWYTLEILGSM